MTLTLHLDNQNRTLQEDQRRSQQTRLNKDKKWKEEAAPADDSDQWSSPVLEDSHVQGEKKVLT